VSINQSIVGRSRSSEQVATLGLLDRPQQGLANECGCICGPWSFQQLAKSITNKLLRMQIPRSERGLSRTLSPVLSNFRAEAVASHPHTQAVADSRSLQLFLRATRCDGSVVSDSNKSAVYSNKKKGLFAGARGSDEHGLVSHLAPATCSSPLSHQPPGMCQLRRRGDEQKLAHHRRGSSHLPLPRGHVVPQGIGAGTETGPYVCTNYH
jgi:hypothetical protein